MSKELTPGQRRTLRGKAHLLHPLVLIGDKGLTDAVLREIEVHLRSHELIKVRAQSERNQREAMLGEICQRLSAQPVQHVGKTLVIYRERPPEPAAEPARRPARAVTNRAVAKPAPPRTQSKRAADRARARVSAERAPAAAPARRRARTR
jgi:RNA-binding protein